MRSNAPGKSSSSVKVTFLDLDLVKAELKKSVADLKAREPSVRRVILFGSLARGDHGARSDADVLVILVSSEVPPRKRLGGILPYFDHSPVSVDVIPLTEAEVQDRVSRRDPFILRLLREGEEIG